MTNTYWVVRYFGHFDLGSLVGLVDLILYNHYYQSDGREAIKYSVGNFKFFLFSQSAVLLLQIRRIGGCDRLCIIYQPLAESTLDYVQMRETTSTNCEEIQV